MILMTQKGVIFTIVEKTTCCQERGGKEIKKNLVGEKEKRISFSPCQNVSFSKLFLYLYTTKNKVSLF